MKRNTRQLLTRIAKHGNVRIATVEDRHRISVLVEQGLIEVAEPEILRPRYDLIEWSEDATICAWLTPKGGANRGLRVSQPESAWDGTTIFPEGKE